MKKLMKLLRERMEAKGLDFDNNKDIDCLLISIEAGAGGIDLSDKEEKAFGKAKNKLQVIIMTEICQEVARIHKAIKIRVAKRNEK